PKTEMPRPRLQPGPRRLATYSWFGSVAEGLAPGPAEALLARRPTWPARPARGVSIAPAAPLPLTIALLAVEALAVEALGVEALDARRTKGGRPERRPGGCDGNSLRPLIAQGLLHGDEPVAVRIDVLEVAHRTARRFPLVQADLPVAVGVQGGEPRRQARGEAARPVHHRPRVLRQRRTAVLGRGVRRGGRRRLVGRLAVVPVGAPFRLPL